MTKPTRNAIMAVVVIAVVVTIGYMAIYANNPFAEIFTVSDTLLNTNSMARKVLNKEKVPAPELVGIQQWLNTVDGTPRTLEELRGKVVLIDFWTYSCINCIRTLPHITEWDRKYRDKGLVIIGVHTPEFNFEKNPDNVLGAIEEYGIEYPVALDNDYKTWRAYRNHFWPAKYFIDHEGNVVWQHFGEGAYEESERVIQQLLVEAGTLEAPMKTSVATTTVDFTQIGTPEIYFGSDRISHFGSSRSVRAGQTYAFDEPSNIQRNTFYLTGQWKIESEYAELVGGPGKISIRFEAKKANIVMESASTVTAVVKLDGQHLNETNRGTDVQLSEGISTVEITGARLYNFTDTPSYGEHTLELIFQDPGVKAFAFTFG